MCVRGDGGTKEISANIQEVLLCMHYLKRYYKIREDNLASIFLKY